MYEMNEHKVHTLAFILLIVGLAAAVLAIFLPPPSTDETDRTTASPPPPAATTLATGEYALYVPTQKPGNRVHVSIVRTKVPAWVVIHEGSTSGEPIGYVFFPGASADQSGGGSVANILRVGQPYTAVLHKDDGDLSFNAEHDPPLLDATSDPIAASFTVERNADPAAPEPL